MKKYLCILTVLFFFPIIVFGQKQEDFSKLVEKLNHCLFEYNKFPYHRSDNYYSINCFGLSKQEIKELIADANYDKILNANKDSIQESYMIDFFRSEIEIYLDKIIKHSDFFKNDIASLLKSEILSIVKSDDNKLLNISFDEKMGGTYQSQVSKMYYIDIETTNVIDLNQADNSIFASDGYNAIYTLQTAEGIKYVLTGFVRGCSSCFETFVQLIKFSENEFIEEFKCSVTSRDWNCGVKYNHEEKAIFIDYFIDDLTPGCYCSEEEFDYDKLIENRQQVNCNSKFIFDGQNFELIEASWKIIDNKLTK